MKIRFLVLSAILSAVIPAISQMPDGKLISKETYRFPPFAQAVDKTFAELYASKEEYERSVSDKRFEFSKLTYSSDGLKVRAYLYRPKRSGKHPTIIFNRGGLVRDDIAPELISIMHNLASAGFVVIAPMYRQSDGGEGRDEVGGKELNDLMNIVPLIRSFHFVDTDNLFLYGESRGGVMTYLALKQKFPARAAAVFGAISDVEGFIKENQQTYPLAALNQIWKGYDQDKENILRTRSAIKWVEEIKSPILIMHGGGDRQVNPLQSLSVATKLQALGRRYQLVIYAGDNHFLTMNRNNRDREAVLWFRSFLRGK